MSVNNKHFAQRLKKCLDDMEAPAQIRERSAILSKLLDITKPQARMLIEGVTTPDDELTEKIMREFEVERKWLIGEKS